jgi:hypothetical protein
VFGKVANMTNQKPCSCGGSNENCALCYGRGFIEDGARGKQARSQSYDSILLSALLSAQNIVKCPACKFKGLTDEFTKHFALAHGTKGRLRGRIEVPNGYLVRSSNSIGVRKTKKTGKNAAAKPQYPVAEGSQESLRYKSEVEAESPSWRNNLDSTKNYGYPARETGRYGSHPSHDGFDDESKP